MGNASPFVFDDEQKASAGPFVFDDEAPAKRVSSGPFVFDDELTPKAQTPVAPKVRTWGQAVGDSAIDAAKGVIGLGQSVVGITDLATGNLSGKGWSELGYDPEAANQFLDQFYSDARQQANRNVGEANGFVDKTKALTQNPSTIVGSAIESAPLMLGGIAAVRTVAMKMLAARGIAAGSAEAAAFLARPEVAARLAAVSGAAEGATTAGQTQEQGRAAGRSYWETAPSAVAAGALDAVISVGSSKIPGFHDAEVGAATAGMGKLKRETLLAEGKTLAKQAFKEGVLEELPQSAQEQIFQNLAMGKPWDEGVGDAAAQGMVVGAAQGGGMHAYSAGRNALSREPIKPAAAPSAPAPTAPAAAPTEDRPQSAAAPATSTPEIRLAELEITSQQRELTADEQIEAQDLASALHERDLAAGHGGDAQQFDDVPNFDQAEAPAQDSGGTAQGLATTDETTAPNGETTSTNGETEVPASETAAANGETATVTPQPAPYRPYWDGFQTGDRVQTPHGTTGTLKISDDGHLAYLVHDFNNDGTPNTDGSMFSVTPQEVRKLDAQPTMTPAQAPAPEAKKPTDFWTFAREKGMTPASLKVGTPQWQALKSEFDMLQAGFVPESQPPAQQQPAPEPSSDLQNRDRSRAASVVQMQDIAKAPDYGRLGISRTPDSGAPMVFPVADDGKNIPDANFGRQDVAVMSDGQRVPFIYAVVPAHQVMASNFADGNVNPKYDAAEPGTLKALNNGRTAGLQAAYMRGKADNYKAELLQDVPNHGVPAEVINRTVNPMLVRVYRDADNTPGMGAKSQGQGLSLSPGELARQDAPLMDATVLTAYRPGDVTSAANRDFVRAFVGKLRHHGQDVAAMMTADGTLSPAGRTRIQAALVQAAYGDADLVNEMFDSQDSDIKAIGTALKAVAGQWADMRDSARMGAIDPQVDITGNLVQAINLIRKSRQENVALTDLASQVDLLTGQAPDPITVAMLRFFYRGEKNLSLALGSDKVAAKLNAYVTAAMSTSTSLGMFDDAVTVDRILQSINNEANHGTHQAQNNSAGTGSGGNPGLDLDQGRSGERRPGSGEVGQEPGGAGAAARERTTEQGVQEGDQGNGAGQDRTGQRSKRDSASQVSGKIEDAGEKIGGARKDRWKDRGLDLSDLDSMSEAEGAELATKANVWKPDYSAMVKAGTRPHTAASIKVIFDSLAAKPKVNTPEGRRQYVTAMREVRQVYTDLATLDALEPKSGRQMLADAAETLKTRLGVRSKDPATVKQGRALLFSVYKGRSDPFVVDFNTEQRARKLVAEGFPDGSEPWKKRLSVVAFGGAGMTERGIEIAMKDADAAGTPVTAEQLKAGVYRVVSKAGKALAYLPTRTDAEAAAKTIYDGKLKGGASDKAEPSRPHLDTLKRENLPQRIDRDVSTDDFIKDFGFRGVEFGNWAAQDERQRILNMAYDGLHDLAEIMGVPPKAMSLNGTLGMAFGARGGGKFAAHYEPGKLVINMTKLQGGGSMAHEWAHALDHYLGELNRTDAYTTAARGASGWYTEEQYKGVPIKRMEQIGKEWKAVEKLRLDNLRPEMAQAFDRVMSSLFSGQETKAQMVRGLELQLERTQALAAKESDPQLKAMYERTAASQSQNLEEARQEPEDKTYPKGRSEFAKEAQKLSGKSKNGYWSRPTEMFARAFESWVFDKVAAMGAQSDYLVHGVEADRFAAGAYKGNPYPSGAERATINAAFDNLAKTILTKETDKGVAMFSRGASGKSMPASTIQQVVDQVTGKWTHAPAVEVLGSMDEAPDAVRKEYERQNSKGASGSTEGFFYGGTVYLVADQLATPTDAMRVLFHEALGHMGLRGVFGDGLKPILTQIVQTRRAEVAAKAKQYGLDMSKPDEALRAAEEVLAGMAQEKPELGFVKRAIAEIRTWLRTNVPGFKDLTLTDDEIIASYILPARAFVQGNHAPATQSGAPAFSRNSLGDEPVPPVAGAQANAWTTVKNRVMSLTSPENIDKLTYEFQDKFIDLKRIQEHIKALGGTVSDLNDAYLGEELFHKRLAKRTEDFLAHELKPLLAGLKEHGITLEQFETFLHARHAPEANAAMAERNPNRATLDKVKAKADATVKDLELKLEHARANHSATKAILESLSEARAEAAKWHGAQAYSGSEEKRLSLSGMSDEEAAAVMAGLDPETRLKMDALAEKVDAINSKTLDVLEGYGLMDRGAIAAWRREYQFYIPLHRDEAQADSSTHPIGAGFSVKGSAAKSRVGSNEKVTHILGHIAMQREAALTRGEKNLVAKQMYVLAAQNPDEDLWTVDAPPMIKTLDSRTGTVRLGVDPLYKNRPNVLMVRIAGKDVAIVFNEHNAQGMRLVSAMKNLDVGDLHVVLGLAAKGTRWFASVNTQYNPIFGLINFARDFQDGMINLSTTPLQGKQLDIAKNVFTAMRAIYRTERGKGSAGAENQQWMDLWNDMQEVGGTTGYRDLYADAADRVKALEKELKALDRGDVSKAAHAVVDWLSVYNETMENAVRLSAYKVGLDNGMTKQRAASLTKNLTVNFNRKGRQTREVGALYAFFNASMQGTARMAETLKGPLGQRIMYGGVAIGAINALVGMALMGGSGDKDDEDEWSKIPDFIKERSLIIPLSHTQYVSIPMPLGFKIFPNIGRVAMETAFGGPTKTVGKGIGDLLSSLVDAFNPLGGAQNLGQLVAPTVIDPVVALMQNEDWTGRPIYRENNSPLSPQPGTKMVRDSASTPGRMLAEAINKITGGTNYRPGAWSPTPDQIDYVFGQLTGGLGRELLKANQAITAPFTGDELPAYKIPLVGRLYGDTSGPSGQSERFYANVKTLNEVENELKGRALHRENYREYRDSEPLTSLIGLGNASERQISQYRNLRRQLVQEAKPGYQERVKDIDKRIGEVMARLNREVDQVQRKAAAK